MKLKTHKSAAKRIKITKNKKLKRRRAFRSHLREKKDKDRKRMYRKELDFALGDEKRMKKLLPYM
jgi:large subunit ribosomal protein L35